MHHPTDRITNTTAFDTSRGALAGTRNSSMGFGEEGIGVLLNTHAYTHTHIQGRIYISGSMGCHPGTPRLEGPHPHDLKI